MTHIENKIAQAILKYIGNDDEGGFSVEVIHNGIHHFAEGTFVTEGHMSGGDYYTPGLWIVNYTKAEVEIKAYDEEGEPAPHNCSERIIEEFIEECLYTNGYTPTQKKAI